MSQKNVYHSHLVVTTCALFYGNQMMEAKNSLVFSVKSRGNEVFQKWLLKAVYSWRSAGSDVLPFQKQNLVWVLHTCYLVLAQQRQWISVWEQLALCDPLLKLEGLLHILLFAFTPWSLQTHLVNPMLSAVVCMPVIQWSSLVLGTSGIICLLLFRFTFP